MKLSDGSILTSNLEPESSGVDNYAEMYNTNKLHVGQILKVIYRDDERNRSKRFVEYDVILNEQGITTSIFRNCRSLDSFGDENNFSEKVLQPITEGKQGKKDDSEAFVYKNGALVVLGFIASNKESPVILGGLQHPNIQIDGETTQVAAFEQVGSSTSRDERLTELPTLQPGAKAEGDNQGQRIMGEFQGLRWNINKDGELTIIYQGPKNDKGELEAADTQPTIIKINKDGEIFMVDNLDQEIKISRKDKKITISSGNDPADFIEISREQQTITHEMSKDEIHNIGQDQKSTIERHEQKDVKGKSTTNVQQNKQVTVGGDSIEDVKKRRLEKVAGTWRVTVGGEVVFSYPTMKLGSDGASEPVVLGTTWNTYHTSVIVATLNALIAQVAALTGAMNTHTHNYTWTDPAGSGTTSGPSATGPSGPSAAAAAPAAAFSTKTKAE